MRISALYYNSTWLILHLLRISALNVENFISAAPFGGKKPSYVLRVPSTYDLGFTLHQQQGKDQNSAIRIGG